MSYETKELGDLGDVDFGRRADAAVDHIVAHKRAWERTTRRPPSLSYREALIASQAELHLLYVMTGNWLNGIEPTRQDLDRLALSNRRLGTIIDEVIR